MLVQIKDTVILGGGGAAIFHFCYPRDKENTLHASRLKGDNNAGVETHQYRSPT